MVAYICYLGIFEVGTLYGDHQLQGKAYLSPSDTSIDESVKSAQAGKDVSTLKS